MFLQLAIGLELTLLGLGHVGLVQVVCWLCAYQDLPQSFSRWITVPRKVKPEVEGQVFCNVYGHDLKDLKVEEYKGNQYSHAETSRIASTSFLVMYVFGLEASGKTFEFGHLKDR